MFELKINLFVLRLSFGILPKKNPLECHFEAGDVLKLFLIFGHFDPRCSYKLGSYKKKRV